MQDCPNIHNICIGISGFWHCFLKPRLELPPLFRRVYVLIVFYIIKYNQVRSPVAVFTTSDLFSWTDCLHFYVRFCENNAWPPSLISLQRTKVFNDVPIFLQFCFNIFQKTFCLFGRVWNEDAVMLVSVQNRMERILKGEICTLGVSSWCSNHLSGTLQPWNFFRSLCWISGFQYPFRPYAIQFLMECRGFSPEIMREVCPSKISKVKCCQFLPESFLAFYLFPCFKTLPELFPFLPVISISWYIIYKKLFLIGCMVNDFLIRFLIQFPEPFINFNHPPSSSLLLWSECFWAALQIPHPS